MRFWNKFEALLYIIHSRSALGTALCLRDLTHSINWRTRLQTVNQSNNNHLHTPTPWYLLLLLLWDGRLIRKSLPFSLCSNSANSSVTKLKSAHKIGTTVVFGAPVQISIAIGHTIAHVLVFYCCCFCFLYVVLFLGFSLFVTSMKKRVTAMTQSQSAVWTELRLFHNHSQTTRWVNISSMYAIECVCEYLH